MQRNSTNYILIFTVSMTGIVAVILAGMFSFLKDIHTENERNYNKKQILSSLNSAEDFKAEKMADADVANLFETKVEGAVIDAKGALVEGKNAEDIDMEKEEKKPSADRLYPVFKYTSDKAEYYILSVRGNGLWDKIWGWIAIENTGNRKVAGAAFGHKGETPGLGAEISDNTGWKSKFKDKNIFKDGKYEPVAVVKGVAKKSNFEYEVDGISGATVTCNGVTEMLDRGLEVYVPYLVSVEKK